MYQTETIRSGVEDWTTTVYNTAISSTEIKDKINYHCKISGVE